MIPYRGELEGCEISTDFLRRTEHSEAHYELVEKFLDIGKGEQGMGVFTKWLGLPD